MIDATQNYLFIGAGGMGMAPLACWMSQAGHRVCGYDAHLQERVRHWLVSAGVHLEDFIFPEQIQHYSTVVYSSAVSQAHPLLVAAREAGLRCVRRGELLAEIAAHKRFIAVVGSHGKTTTSGMIAHGLRRCGIAADYILGGLSADPTMAPARASDCEWLVAEVDESDGTIDGFAPAVTLVLNVDWDHADRYGDAAKLDAAFVGLLNRTRDTVWLPQSLHLQSSGGAAVHYFDGAAEWMQLDSPPRGRFNQKNGDAAAAVLSLFGQALQADTLASFPGMARRQSLLYRDQQLSIVEDYAHHPTEVDALIECLRGNEPERRLVVVFQPHRYSRTRQFKHAFAQSLQAADEVYLLPVYAAHESVLPGGATSDLAAAFSHVAPVQLEMSLAGVQDLAAAIGTAPTQLAFVGAGDIEEFAGAFSSWIGAQRTPALTASPTGQSVSGDVPSSPPSAAGSIAERAVARAQPRRLLDRAAMDYLRARLSPDCRLKCNEPLANKTTIRIGGAARLYAEPANFSDVRVLLRAAELFQLATFCIGRGSNLLVSDQGFDGLVIRFSAPAWRRVEPLGPDRIWAAAGGRLKEICGFAARHGLGGFEFLEGIPGAVGGALRMNAGAMGSWMFDVVERVQFIDAQGHYQDWPQQDFHFGYRKVEEISRGIALGAVLRSVDSDTETAIRERIDNYSSSRKESQPRGASAGCIFKNPEGNYAGKLIDELGIKGMRVGAAEVSDVHGNFIVNHGGATAADVIELVRRVRLQVQTASGYILEPEVLLVGQSWDEVLSE
ncbi:UDP-N-acetylmuramate dehydrogenase [Coraliomargarita sp. SDUM461004]|uniref:UDP-N-acetylenolpyruvoylglucosamine reductase n=1 Tax=Thalassobacterium sedimentorum TaxID=3041258 RepID=A0ABU1ALC4_9BACT|nr:UDP-N-acetylmuramate dehydrogenase [Coraliomargarita sp. SDUM461004]MDQ8195602.1 UDP-N-acetylmuramate dehydrogenase [Coraliomargarita sp. SDUM461004]